MTPLSAMRARVALRPLCELLHFAGEVSMILPGVQMKKLSLSGSFLPSSSMTVPLAHSMRPRRKKRGLWSGPLGNTCRLSHEMLCEHLHLFPELGAPGFITPSLILPGTKVVEDVSKKTIWPGPEFSWSSDCPDRSITVMG